MKKEKNIKSIDVKWKKGNIRYEINEQDRKVVCVYRPFENTSPEIERIICKRTGLSHMDSLCVNLGIDTPVCVGMAVCSPEDTFNEDDGMAVAFMKMYRQFHSYRMNKLHLLIKRIDRIKEQLVSLREDEKDVFKRIKEDTYKRISGEY